MDRSELIEEARVAFVARFGHEPQSVGVAPGRVELLGNHTDYNEGFVLTSAIDRGIAIAGCAREVPQARVASQNYEGAAITFNPSAPVKDPDASWGDYVKGVVDELNKAGATIGGAIANSQYPNYYDQGPVEVDPGVGYGVEDGDAACASRYRSYDPASGTYLGFDGLRHPCP